MLKSSSSTSMRTWACVAYLVKTKGKQGGLVARSVPGLPFSLEPGMEVRFVPPRLEGVRSSVVGSIAALDKGSWLVHFDSVDSIDGASELTGSSCLVRRSDLPVGFETGPSMHWLGYAVEDVRFGNLGSVSRIIENDAQSLLVVGEGDSCAYIPLVPEFIRSVDDEGALITTAVPNGLLDC